MLGPAHRPVGAPAVARAARPGLGLLGLATLSGSPDAQAGAGLQAAVSAGELCLLPPELDARLDASWDPIALSHAEEARAWRWC